MAFHEKYVLPRELESDQQAAVLYSPFREKSLNPQSWTRKMKFWENLLTEAALQRRSVTFDINTLPLLFERKGIRPKCLDIVIEEMKKSGQIRSVEDYKRNNSWLSWGFDTLVKQPLVWGVGKLLGPTCKESGVYVWPEVVKKLCEEVIELHQGTVQNELTDNLVSMAHLRSLCQSWIPSDQDFNIVLTQLERDKKMAVSETPDKEIVVKFCKMGELSVSPIREIDLQVYRIQVTLKKLEEQIEVLSSRARGLTSDARTHLREGRKTMAKHCLRKKKAILRIMDKRSGSLTMLHNILQTIEEASTNDMVVKACETGAAVMKHLHKDLNVEGVESVMDNIREAIDDQEEINQALSSPLSQNDSEQLEQDLEELLNINADDEKYKLTVSSEDKKLNDELNSLLEDGMKGQKSIPDSKTKQLLNSLSLDDLGLPNVPTHSPSQASHKGKTKAGTSTQPLQF